MRLDGLGMDEMLGHLTSTRSRDSGYHDATPTGLAVRGFTSIPGSADPGYRDATPMGLAVRVWPSVPGSGDPGYHDVTPMGLRR